MGRLDACGLVALAALLGCGSTQARVRELGVAEMNCAGSGLRVQAVGALYLRDGTEVELYELEGCDKQDLYYCRQPQGCAADPAALGFSPAERARVARALHVRRTVSRARCPSSEEVVVEESESLYRFEACDRSVLIHCLASGCQALGKRY